MEATVLTATANPMDVIGIAAGMCYGKPTPSPKRVRRCAENGHMSVFEHASATLKIEGISRACLAQLTRHRIASYSVMSQRYCKVDAGSLWYVTPPSVVGTDAELRFRAQTSDAMWSYQAAIEEGMKPEDARYLLPEATKTSLVMTINARSRAQVPRPERLQARRAEQLDAWHVVPCEAGRRAGQEGEESPARRDGQSNRAHEGRRGEGGRE